MKILGAIALSLAILMISLGLYPSWSQYARELEEPLLLGCLFSIASAFLIRSKDALNRNDVILWDCETKFFDVLSFVFFGLILVTPVTHPNSTIEIVHFIVTGCAILISYTALIAQQTSKLMKLSSILSVVLGGGGFLVGFFTAYYSTGEGELIAAFPLAVHIFFTKTK